MTTPCVRIWGCAVISGVLLLSGAFAQTTTVRIPPDVVFERAHRYVREFESTFALVIGDETYEQRIDINQGSSSPVVVNRRFGSELLFMWVPDDHAWTSVRNILTVDGKRVAETDQGLEDALKQPLPERASRIHRLAELSARFNVGSIYRNFNNPTLALQFLDQSYEQRFAFTIHDNQPERTPIARRCDASTSRRSSVRPSSVKTDTITL